MATPLNSLFHGIRLDDQSQGISDRDFNAIRTMIYQEAGISLSDAKRVLVCSRLAKRLRHLNLRSHAEYLDYLATRDAEGAERQVMINCLTTNKTDFFREAHHFTFLRESVFPCVERAAAQGGPRRLRIWSAACSTGEEPYSIAITILEHFGSLRGWDVQVLASDINTEVLQKASEGVYALERIDGLEDGIQRKYFLRGVGRRAGFCQIRPEVRRLVRFRQINFMDQRWPLRSRCDVIFCRNAIIYFDASTQQQLLPRLRRAIDRQRLSDTRPLGKPSLVDRPGHAAGQYRIPAPPGRSSRLPATIRGRRQLSSERLPFPSRHPARNHAIKHAAS